MVRSRGAPCHRKADPFWPTPGFQMFGLDSFDYSSALAHVLSWAHPIWTRPEKADRLLTHEVPWFSVGETRGSSSNKLSEKRAQLMDIWRHSQRGTFWMHLGNFEPSPVRANVGHPLQERGFLPMFKEFEEPCKA